MQISFVRRLDELGRIVIPKEIRSNLKFNSGELLELNINNDNLIIRKSDKTFNIEYIKGIFNLIEFFCECEIILTDTEKIILINNKKDDFVGQEISEELKNLIFEHKSKNYISGVKITKNLILEKNIYVKSLIKDSNTVGLLIIKTISEIKELNSFFDVIVKLIFK